MLRCHIGHIWSLFNTYIEWAIPILRTQQITRVTVEALINLLFGSLILAAELTLRIPHEIFTWVSDWELIIFHFPVNISSSNIVLIFQDTFDSASLSAWLVSMCKQPWWARSIHLLVLLECSHTFLGGSYILTSFLRLLISIGSPESLLLMLSFIGLLHSL